MTTSLIVLAHPNRGSFCGAWSDATEAACRALGDDVERSDLVSMGFDAVESARHYDASSAPFDPLKAQENVAQSGGIPADVAGEIAKLRRADRVIFHFPMWWFAPPAVLKGWFDRVLLHGAVHTVDERFDTGRFRGKRALFCVTTGATDAECGPGGKEGDVALLLWPTAYTLRYVGMDVLSPLVVSGVHGYHAGADKSALEQRLSGVLKAQHDVMATFEQRAAMAFNPDSDFDEAGRLKPECASVTPFIRRGT